jgi:hypothetical protein
MLLESMARISASRVRFMRMWRGVAESSRFGRVRQRIKCVRSNEEDHFEEPE